MGHLIVIEGTDCSGKETQSKELEKLIVSKGGKVKRYSFPMYDTPTGKIIGGPYLGKKEICNGWFSEGAPNVDPTVASLYYAADRLYNMPKIKKDLDEGYDVILDRYLYSNMAHQGGKIEDKEERNKKYEWLYDFEVGFLHELEPDIRIFIHMPLEGARILKENRVEELDQHEADDHHLISAERAYIEIAEKYDFKTIEAVRDKTKPITRDNIKSIEEISEEIKNYMEEINTLQKVNRL